MAKKKAQKRLLIEQGCEFFKDDRWKHRFVGVFGDRRTKRMLRRALKWEVSPFPQQKPSQEDRAQVVNLDPIPKTFAASVS
jgi:hypothetical protein